MIELYPHQLKAVQQLKIGSILYGEVGTGKTLTSLYFYKLYHSKSKLIIITTAKKRDSGDWEEEAAMLDIQSVHVDSWQNIENYKTIQNAFFIFDEQRVVGNGKWVKSFIKISKRNKWILLSGTPGDKWEDYIPVFIANGFYRNKTDFSDQHLIYNRYVKFPQVVGYMNEGKLYSNRRKVLVEMKMERTTTRYRKNIFVDYDKDSFRNVRDNRWNIYTDEPIKNISEYMSVIRKIINSDPSRIFAAKFLMDIHDRVIVFYNYSYELELLKNACEELDKPYLQWNGRKHEDLPEEGNWIYLVQYTAGAEGWNCITTDTIIFYSLNYSYKVIEQCEGRIDRLNTPFSDLYYYYIQSNSPLDTKIRQSIDKKKKFNTSVWAKRSGARF